MQRAVSNCNQPIPHVEDQVLSITLLGRRWNCSSRVAMQRAEQRGMRIVRFNARAMGVLLSAALRVEEELSRPVTEEISHVQG